MIDHVSLDHGWYYFYRIHKQRISQLNDPFSDLKDYLFEMLEDCPDEHFRDGPRSSKLKIDLGIETREVESHPMTRFAREGLEWDHYNTAHSNVQVYMLNNDSRTLAVEAPIWLEASEMNGLGDYFQEGPLSGHIDLLRYEDDNIWIWDYKPNARREKYATTQTFLYALMLSRRTGIPLENFRCGYFDTDSTFIFRPEEEHLLESFQ